MVFGSEGEGGNGRESPLVDEVGSGNVASA